MTEQITDSTTRFIDISKFQLRQTLHWDKLPADISAVIMRATYGTTRDPRFAQHLESVVDAGRSVGCYHFVTYAPADEQWQAFQETAKDAMYGDANDVIPVLDCEWLPGEKKPKDAHAYVERVEEMAYEMLAAYGNAIIYTATGFWEQCGSPSSWLEFPMWLAHYPKDRDEAGARAFADRVYTPRGAGQWQMWQSGPRVIPGFCKNTIDYNYSRIELPLIGNDNAGRDVETINRESCG